jgi:hypothetical protein
MTTEATDAGCPGCVVMRGRASTKPGNVFHCYVDGCREAHYVVPREAPYVAPPPRVEALAPIEPAWLDWTWTPKASVDMLALAKHPAIAAQDVGKATRPRPSRDEDPTTQRARERSAEIERRRADHARERLAEMRGWGALGRRYAAITWWVHGVRGEALNVRESPAEDVAQRFGEPLERAAFRARFDAAHAGLTPKQRDAMAARAYGAALAEAAEDAYHTDAWRRVADPSKAPAPVAPKGRKQRFAARVAASWAAKREKVATMSKRDEHTPEELEALVASFDARYAADLARGVFPAAARRNVLTGTWELQPDPDGAGFACRYCSEGATYTDEVRHAPACRVTLARSAWAQRGTEA